MNKNEHSTPVSPIQNLYLPHLLPLIQVKLRIGHAMARMASNEMKNKYVAIFNLVALNDTSLCCSNLSIRHPFVIHKPILLA